MGGTEKEVALRKKRHDYTISKGVNPIREGTTITVIPQKRFYRAETILSKTKQIKADKRKFDNNTKRKESHNFPLPDANLKFALVIRLIDAKANICPESKKILSDLKLNEKFDGCFVFLNEENRQKLKSINHLITYGSPSQELVRQLIHTRASTVVNGKEVHITSNKMIADALSDKNIICLDDMVHAFNKGDDNKIEAITAFLAPFHFNKTELKNIKLPLYAGGPSGWRGNDIIQFIEAII